MARTTTTGRRRAVVVSTLTTAAVASALLVGIDAPAQAGAAQGATAAATTIPPGRLAAAVAKVDSLASDLMAKTHIPGMAIAIVHGGKTIYAKGFGVRKAGSPGKVGADTVFQLASVSKSVGATVVAREVGRKVVRWDTPVSRNLPWFRLSDPYVTRNVTIGDLYAHRSGLPEHAGDVVEDIGYNRRQVLDRLQHWPLNRFRDSYAYTNFGLTAAAQSVAKAAGTSWATLSERALYRPLGMSSTSSRFSDFVKRKDRAYGHVQIDGRWVAKYVRRPDAQSPAGGVSSSVNDMAKWLQLLLANGKYQGRTVVKPSALLPALSPQSVSRPPTTVGAQAGINGFGFNLGRTRTGDLQLTHSGAFSLGAGTAYTAVPAADLAIVSLTNAAPQGIVETLNAEFMDLALYGSVQQDWWGFYHPGLLSVLAPSGSLVGRTAPAHPAKRRARSAYTGTYSNEVYGPVTVTRVRGGLSASIGIGADRITWRLEHWNGSVFAVRPSLKQASTGSAYRARFARFASGHARTLRLEYFDESGLGTFRR